MPLRHDHVDLLVRPDGHVGAAGGSLGSRGQRAAQTNEGALSTGANARVGVESESATCAGRPHPRCLATVRGSPNWGNMLLSAKKVISAMLLPASVSTISP